MANQHKKRPRLVALPTPEAQSLPDDDTAATVPAVSHNPGRAIYKEKLEEFAKLDDKEKHALLQQTWKDIAMGAALRAKQFISTCSPKDFNNVYRLVMSGAVAIDKAYPPEKKLPPPLTPALVVNMFGTLGQRAANIAMPETPERQVKVIDVTAKEVQSGVATSLALEAEGTRGSGQTDRPSDAGECTTDDGGLGTPCDLGSGLSADAVQS